MTPLLLSSRFEAAFQYALALHRAQMRKGTDIPYMSHLLGVTALVLEDGGDEDLAIAALLHDAPEDQGGEPTLAEIERRFGSRVAAIVSALSDTFETPKPPWRARKQRYLQHLQSASPDVRQVSLADKLHNARAIASDYRRIGDVVFDRFTGGKDGTLWYYQSLTAIFDSDPSPMVAELKAVVGEFSQMSG